MNIDAFTWWPNRKSRIGQSTAAIKPPHVNGRPWWTTPPVAEPQPEHIEYVFQFMRQLQDQPGSQERNRMMGHVSQWMKAARRLLHERIESNDGDLHTIDGLICRADRVLRGLPHDAWGKLSEDKQREFNELRQALRAKAHEILYRKATSGHGAVRR